MNLLNRLLCAVMNHRDSVKTVILPCGNCTDAVFTCARCGRESRRPSFRRWCCPVHDPPPSPARPDGL